jgi:hypothetical protein
MQLQKRVANFTPLQKNERYNFTTEELQKS